MAANAAYLQTGLVSAQVQLEYVLHLFLYQILEGSADANQKVIVNPGLPNYFGLTAVNDWAVYDGILPNGKLVARAQGIHVGAGKIEENWFYSFSMMFIDDRFKGSVLKVDRLNGPNPGAGGQWAIVGGTGEFAHAQGTITYTDEAVSGGVMKELHISVVCPSLAKEVLKVLPPIGGNEGIDVDVTAKPQRLESVTIRSGDVIDSISFSYIDEAGKKQTAGPWGGGGGASTEFSFGVLLCTDYGCIYSLYIPHKINLKPNETMKKIIVTTGDFGGLVVVNSLKILTNLDTYGPYGKESGTQFAIPEMDNVSVVGFYGRITFVLHAIGVYTTASAVNVAEN